jgi:hypothetical protein
MERDRCSAIMVKLLEKYWPMGSDDERIKIVNEALNKETKG